MIVSSNKYSESSSLLEKYFLLTLFVIPIWPRYAMIYIPGLPDINLTRVMIFTLILLWVITLIGFRRHGVVINEFYNNNKRVVHILIALLLWRTLIVISTRKLSAMNILLEELFSWFLLFGVGATVWAKPHRIHRALMVIIFSSIIINLLGLLELYLEHNIFLSVIGTPSEDVEKVVLGRSYREGYRIMSTFSNTLSLAEYLVFIVPIAIYVYTTIKSPILKAFSVLSLFMSLLNIWFTRSRGAWAVLIIMGIAFAAIYYRRKINKGTRKIGLFIVSVLLPMILIISIFGVFVISELVSGRSPEEALSSAYRLKQLQMGVPLSFNRPIAGYGLGEAAEVVSIYRRSVDNYYLLLALESGLPSLVLFLYLLYLIVRVGFRIYIKSENELDDLAGVIAVSIIGFATYLSVLSLKQVFPIVFLTFAMILCLRSHDNGAANEIMGHTISGDHK